MNEFEILDRYAKGLLKGLFITDTCFYIPVRVTGLGKSLRLDEDETLKVLAKSLGRENITIEEAKKICDAQGLSVYNFARYKTLDRRPEEFANGDVLSRYQSLPITLDHPHDEEGNTALLSYSTIKDTPIIGTLVKAYMFEGAVWGIAKIFDLSLLKKLGEFKSTSPAIESYDIIEQGELIERPLTFNHLAFVREGHWDCKGEKAMDISRINVSKEVEMKSKEDAEKEEIEISTPSVESVDEEESPTLESVSKDVEEIKEVESEEAEKFEALAEEHKNLKGDLMRRFDSIEADIKRKIDTALGFGETKEDEDEDIKAKKDADEDVKADEDVEVVAPKEMASEDDAEEITEEEVVDEDEEREEVLDSLRALVDSVDKGLGVRVPYINKRLTAAETIKAFLDKNFIYVDKKYLGLVVDSKSSKGRKARYNRELFKEALKSTCENIKKRDALYKIDSKKSRGWAPTDKPNVLIDKNF